MNNLIAFCGLNCETCEARIATINNDNQLRCQVADKWSKMNNTDQITPETINCEGCRTGGVKFYYCSHLCPIRQCASQKGFSTCADCNKASTCQILSPIVSTNNDAKNNLGL